ncbi:MAG: hypothetical protein HY738_13750 [Bacteroidia bacterium]|nr:hypothetical protein [Bacteroidia bacterium]
MKAGISIVTMIFVFLVSGYAQRSRSLPRNLRYSLSQPLVLQESSSLDYATKLKVPSFQGQFSSLPVQKKGVKKGRLVAGLILAGLGAVQIVIGFAIFATSPLQSSYDNTGTIYYSPTEGRGMGGFLLMFNGAGMAGISVPILISSKKKSSGGYRRTVILSQPPTCLELNTAGAV